MMRRFLLPLFFGLIICVQSQAQQEPLFSNYIWNPLSFNPGVAGTSGFMTMNATIREQWVGFEGRPRTQAFNMHTVLKKREFGIGASIINDNIGPINSTTLQGNFAYKLKLDRGVYISLGLKAEASLWQGKFAGLELADDPSFATDIRSAFLPNFGFGAYLKGKKYFAGISVPRFIRNEFNDGEANWNQGDQVHHFYAHGGYSFKLNRDLYFKPSVMMNYVKNVPFDATITTSLEFERQLWIGLGYRVAQSLTPTIAYKFNHQIKAGYAYEYMVNSLAGHQFGSHELLVTYDFFYPKGRVVSPIFF